jgi:hypothetical protein
MTQPVGTRAHPTKANEPLPLPEGKGQGTGCPIRPHGGRDAIMASLPP